MVRAAWIALLLLAPLVVAAAPAMAQQAFVTTSVDMTLPNLARPVPPGESSVFNNSVTVRYNWQQGGSSDPTEVRIEVVEEPSWLNSTFSPDLIEFNTIDQPTGGPETFITNLTLEADANAPAFEETIARYRVVAEENGMLQGSERIIEFEVTAGFKGRIQATLPGGERVPAQGGFVTKVPVRLENLGNGPVIVEAEVVRFPAESKIAVPVDIVLGTSPEDRVRTVHLDVEVPWKVSEEGPVEVRFTPSHAQRGDRGPQAEIGFELDGNSVVPIPGPSPWLVVALVGLLVLARRRWE